RDLDQPTLVQMIVACDAGSRQVRSSGAPRALLDAVLVRLCHMQSFAEAAHLLQGTSGPPAKKDPARAR
ncbi:MAG: hypothetical protein VXX86_04405, partial [Planctomycetota bacterium]|nr:hypothetical protein [Planctomycetota bacterium]